MQNLQRLTGSTNHLVIFQVAASSGSFSQAANKLGISQPAVSQSVRRLESAIGVTLFVRQHKKLQLTDAGTQLATEIEHSFSRVARTIVQIQQQGRSDHVTLNISSAFAHYWLVPRLQKFRADHRDIDLRIQQTDKELDLASEGISLSVWRGNGNWTGYESALLAQEQLYALASPSWIKNHPAITTLEQLTECNLITLEEPYREVPSWNTFFASLDTTFIDTGGGLRLNDYALALQAGLAGDGILLGWHHITAALVEQELLQRVTTHECTTSAGFYLVWSDRVKLSDKALRTRDWIIDAR